MVLLENLQRCIDFRGCLLIMDPKNQMNKKIDEEDHESQGHRHGDTFKKARYVEKGKDCGLQQNEMQNISSESFPKGELMTGVLHNERQRADESENQRGEECFITKPGLGLEKKT